ncbi:MAG: hypothetical protein HYX26_10420 [Acidobacteriales bacterium]|nr:hypothetical protein [Terriglobales bacterium]
MTLPTVLLPIALLALAPVKLTAEDRPAPGRVVDSGTFGIIVNGNRVATETFRMEQNAAVNVVTAQLKQEAGGAATQTVEMQINANGELRKYVWKEAAPTKAQIVVEPQDHDFIVRRVSEDEKQPSKDTTHPVSASTPILDDNYYSQMEVLLWKYMAMGCQTNPQGGQDCNLLETRMPVFNPHQGESQLLTLKFLGTQRLKWKGQDKVMNLFSVKSEGTEAMVWLDGYSLVRVLVPAEHTEVLRD